MVVYRKSDNKQHVLLKHFLYITSSRIAMYIWDSFTYFCINYFSVDERKEMFTQIWKKLVENASSFSFLFILQYPSSASASSSSEPTSRFIPNKNWGKGEKVFCIICTHATAPAALTWCGKVSESINTHFPLRPPPFFSNWIALQAL